MVYEAVVYGVYIALRDGERCDSNRAGMSAEAPAADRLGRHDIAGGPGVAAFPVTDGMRDYLAAFDRFLTAPCGPQAAAARQDMTRALSHLHHERSAT
jgi:hypothetical protein